MATDLTKREATTRYLDESTRRFNRRLAFYVQCYKENTAASTSYMRLQMKRYDRYRRGARDVEQDQVLQDEINVSADHLKGKCTEQCVNPG